MISAASSWKYCIVALIISLSYTARAQKIEIVGLDTVLNYPIQAVRLINSMNWKDSAIVLPLIGQITDTLHWQGYFEAGIDSIIVDTLHACLYYHVGNKYTADKIYIDSYLDQTSDSVNVRSNQNFITELNTQRTRLLKYSERRGYPFSYITLSATVRDSVLNVRLTPHTERLIRMGGVHVVGNLKINDDYIERIIGFERGHTYSPEYVESATKKIREISFADQYRAPVVVFAENKAYMALFLNKKNTDRFDILIGLQPNNSSIPGVNNRLLLTGSATVELINKLGNGERILAEFFRPSAEKQQIRVELEYPYILHSPFSLNGAFKLFKSDSSFIETYFLAGGQYYFNFTNKLNVYWNRNTSDIKSLDLAAIILQKKLPELFDLKTDFYGLELNMVNVDFKFNPRRGHWINLKSGIGIRRIIPNAQIQALIDPDQPEFSFASLYDTVQSKKAIFKPELEGRFYLPMRKNFTLMTKVLGGGMFGPEKIYNNEKFRLGGISNLRGFNEQSLLSSLYLQATIEPRLLLDEMSALYVFADNALLNFNKAEFSNLQWYMGLGAGLNVGTRIGVFAINAAVGKSQGGRFDLRSTKIHFGYLSIF
ncbi:MAG TPA: BamA/TamA family outer membrane protein [Saprospiraceae bacterium]|nr:BamA/TamA family outer membrane protein [Saprospiraceae bacterium]